MEPARGRLDLRDLANPAGALTLARIPLALAFPFFADQPAVALSLYAAAVLSDIADGVIARRTGTSSHTGAMVDGFLDKVFHVNAAWSLVLVGTVPAWYLLCWFPREILQLLMVPWLWKRFIAARVQVYQAHWSGKAASWLVGIALCAAILHLDRLSLGTTLAALPASLLAALHYLRREVQDQRANIARSREDEASNGS